MKVIIPMAGSGERFKDAGYFIPKPMIPVGGKMMIEQHRMVLGLVQREIDSGEVHALTLKTYTPEQFERSGKSVG